MKIDKLIKEVVTLSLGNCLQKTPNTLVIDGVFPIELYIKFGYAQDRNKTSVKCVQLYDNGDLVGNIAAPNWLDDNPITEIFTNQHIQAVAEEVELFCTMYQLRKQARDILSKSTQLSPVKVPQDVMDESAKYNFDMGTYGKVEITFRSMDDDDRCPPHNIFYIEGKSYSNITNTKQLQEALARIYENARYVYEQHDTMPLLLEYLKDNGYTAELSTLPGTKFTVVNVALKLKEDIGKITIRECLPSEGTAKYMCSLHLTKGVMPISDLQVMEVLTPLTKLTPQTVYAWTLANHKKNLENTPLVSLNTESLELS